jgi:hypothetical protein
MRDSLADNDSRQDRQERKEFLTIRIFLLSSYLPWRSWRSWRSWRENFFSSSSPQTTFQRRGIQSIRSQRSGTGAGISLAKIAKTAKGRVQQYRNFGIPDFVGDLGERSASSLIHDEQTRAAFGK